MRDRMLRAIQTDFPALPIDRSRVVETGWDNDAIEINETLIFRFPKADDVRLDVELAVLNYLRGRTTLAIPNVEYVGRTMPYIGYRKIAGSDLTAEIYHDVARFLFEVHQALPVDEAARIGVPMAEPHTHLEVVERLHPRIDDAAVAGFAAATIDEYSQLIATEGPPSFLHNDLHGDNMAFDARASRLNGVFDFGDAAIGDVHRDFSPLYKVHRGLLEDVVREYGTLSGTNLSLRRIVVYQRIDRLTDIAQLIDRPDEPELAKAVGDLRRWAREQSVYAP